MYVDPDGRLWTGLRDGVVGLPLEGDRMLSTGKPGIGTVYAILHTSHGLLAAGVNGLAALRGDHFEMLGFADGTAGRGISGMVESDNGDLWLNTSRGVVHVPAADLRTALDSPQSPMKSERITEGDFVASTPLRSGRLTAARDAAGLLWFASSNGVFHIDPAPPAALTHPPILSIRSIAADQTPIRDGDTVGPNVQTLDVQYLGVNLTAPERVIYRYRLDGLDEDWQDAGHRTEAIYTRLRPAPTAFTSWPPMAMARGPPRCPP